MRKTEECDKKELEDKFMTAVTTPASKLLAAHRQNYNTLVDAVMRGRTALMDCVNKRTGERVAVVCAYNVDKDGAYDFVPMAQLFNENPFDILRPPMEEDKNEKI
jgi:hypothetical protein